MLTFLAFLGVCELSAIADAQRSALASAQDEPRDLVKEAKIKQWYAERPQYKGRFGL